ncbi:leucine-rich repeat domain-containing protein, partial [bacterium]|nr:leucine-rich repeat domain-containing protein [bacterium]
MIAKIKSRFAGCRERLTSWFNTRYLPWYYEKCRPILYTRIDCTFLLLVILALVYSYWALHNVHVTIDGITYDSMCGNRIVSVKPDLQNAVIREGTVNIGTAFACHDKLTSVCLPNSVEKIPAGAFFGCTALERVEFPFSSKIGKGAFLGCSSLKSVVLPLNTDFITCDFDASVTIYHGGVVYRNDKVLKVNADAEKVVFADGTKIIGKGVCQGSTHLKAVYIPSTVKYIEDCAFKGCKSLKTKYTCGYLQAIGDEAFYGCEQLSECLSWWPEWGVYGCSSYEVLSADRRVFRYDAVRSVGRRAF